MTKKYVVLNASSSYSTIKGLFLIGLYRFISWASRSKYKDAPVIHIYKQDKINFSAEECRLIQDADKILILGHGSYGMTDKITTYDNIPTSVDKIAYMLSEALKNSKNNRIDISLCVCESIIIARNLTIALRNMLDTNEDNTLNIRVTGRSDMVMLLPFNGRKYNRKPEDGFFSYSHQQGNYKRVFEKPPGPPKLTVHPIEEEKSHSCTENVLTLPKSERLAPSSRMQ
ncbi:MAG: hypothetical protein NTW08_02385 [Gammaproteobacteria bacterium]|nr:hypothetical protein [Gammaproteobacteria bacterium]